MPTWPFLLASGSRLHIRLYKTAYPIIANGVEIAVIDAGRCLRQSRSLQVLFIGFVVTWCAATLFNIDTIITY